MPARRVTSASQSRVTSTPQTRAISLTREQFGESGLPGSEFVRADRMLYESPYSLKRLALMGLIGVGAGAGIGKISKRSLVKGGLIGGAAGVASSLLHDFLTKADEPDVVGASALPGGRGSIIIVGSKRAITRRKSGERIPLRTTPLFLAKTGYVTKNPGWAGAVVAHGLLVQRCMMSYIHEHAKYEEPMQIEPHWGYHVQGSASYTITGNGVFTTEDKDYTNGTLWSNRFAEWPSPIFKRYSIGQPPIRGVMASAASTIMDLSMDSGGGATHLVWEQHLRTALRKYALSMPYFATINNRLQPDPWFNHGTRMDQFNLRYGKTIKRAQWFVWAAEMMRIHSGTSLAYLHNHNSGWVDHCMQWAVGCASDNRVEDKHTMLNYHSKQWMRDTEGNTVADNKNPVIVPLSHSAMKEYLDLVKAITPAPFTSSPEQQITIYPDGVQRTFLDFPEELLGSIVPPMDLINKDWYEALVAQRLSQGAPKGIRVFIYIVQAVVELIASYYGGPAGTLIGGFMAVCFTLIRLGMATNGKISVQDISKLIGTIVSAISDVVDLSSIEGTFTDMLSNMEEVLDDAGLKGTLMGALDAMESLTANSDWPYVNDLLSTTNDIERAVGANVDNAIDNL